MAERWAPYQQCYQHVTGHEQKALTGQVRAFRLWRLLAYRAITNRWVKVLSPAVMFTM